MRDLQFVVSDGKTFAERETRATTHKVRLVDDRALVYRQVNTDKDGKYRITKTYVTDPTRSTVLVDVTFESLTGKPYRLYALYDPSLNNGGDNDTATSKGGQLLASDGKVASALLGAPEFGPSSSGYLGTSDGWTDLKDDYRMDWHYRSASTPGNVVQTARTALTGLSGTGTSRSPWASGPRAREPSRRRRARSRAASRRLRLATGPAGTATSARSRKPRTA